MKVKASVKRICRNCRVIRRKRVVRVICSDPRHNSGRVDFACIILAGVGKWLVLQV